MQLLVPNGAPGQTPSNVKSLLLSSSPFATCERLLRRNSASAAWSPSSASLAPYFLTPLFPLSAIFLSATLTLDTSSSSSSTAFPAYHLASIRSLCSRAPYPDCCFDSLKLSISINISPNILAYLPQILEATISKAGKLSNILQTAGHENIMERQRGTIQDCRELHQITVFSLKRSILWVRDGGPQKLSDARAYLAAALASRDACLEGQNSASGSLMPLLVRSLISTYKHVSNSLSMLAEPAILKGGKAIG